MPQEEAHPRPAATPRPVDHDVLVVEDDADVLESVALILRDHGYRVLTATSGTDAMRVLESGGIPAIILLDLIMPGMDGLTLLERLRADDRFAHVPVTILSAGSIHGAPPGSPFLRKPVSVEDLLVAVAKYCDCTTVLAEVAH